MGFVERIKSVLRPLYVGYFERRYDKKQNKNFNLYYNRVEESIKNSVEKTPKIAFVISLVQCWNSLKTVYEEAVKRGYKTVIVCTDEDKKENLRKTYGVLSKTYADAVFVDNDDGGFDLKSWGPDFVFYTRPYNQALPKSLKAYNVAEYAKICFIPYGYFVGNEKALIKIVYNENFMRSVGTVFASCDSEAKFVKNGYGLNGKRHKIVSTGFPRFDLLPEPAEKADYKNCAVLWAPRWTVTRQDNPTTDSSFLTFKDEVLSRAAKRPDENWIIRPHPKLFGYYAEKGLLTEEERAKYLKTIENLPNAVYDDDGDYYKAIKKADIILADYSGLMMEYVLSGKPVIYFGRERAIESQELRKTVYVVHSFGQAIERIEKIKSGVDEKKEARRKFILKTRPSGKVCEKIADYVEREYNKIKNRK